MKCAVHSDVDAVGYCRNCGKAMCSTCVRPVRDVLYCEDCLATIMGIPGAVPAVEPSAGFPGPAAGVPVRRRPAGNPGLAFVLGFLFPGLGAVYNGQYNKALVHIAVFATIILGLTSDMSDGMKAVLGILLAGFIFYMAFDAMRTAQGQSQGEVFEDPLQSWSTGKPVGPAILIIVGALFLLNNFDLLPFYRIERFWPLILIAVGLLMFRNRLGGRN
jgi:hypothetical protein